MEVIWKKLHLSCLWECLFRFMPMPGASRVLVRKVGYPTVLLVANLFVTMDLSAHRKRHVLTERKKGVPWENEPASQMRGENSPRWPLPGLTGHESRHLLITVPEPQFVERLSGQKCECQYCETNNEQTHHQRVALHSLSPCRMAGKRLTSELLGSFVGLGW